MTDRKFNQVARSGKARDCLPVRREIDAMGHEYFVVGGIRLRSEGFAAADEPQDLAQQCSAFNRRAVMPPPETLAGRTVREIALSWNS